MSYDFACERLRETDNAILVKDPVTDEEIWFPLSQVEELHFDKNEFGIIVVTDWIARKKGIL